MKKIKVLLKSLLVLALTVMMTITSLSINTQNISAGDATEGYDVNLYHGYGRKAYNANHSLTGMGGVDSAYKLSAKTAPGGYSNSTGTTYQQIRQSDITSLDLYYGSQNVTLTPINSSKGNKIYKSVVYLEDGVLKQITGSNVNASSFPSGCTKIVLFQAGSDSAVGNIASRWYRAKEDIALVFHYNNEHKITVNNIETTTINEDFDTYFVDKTTLHKTITAISGDYPENTNTFTDPIEMSVTPSETNITSIDFKVGSTNITLSDLTSIQYLSAGKTFSTTHEDTDILSYNPTTKKFLFYNVTSDIYITFNYVVDVTFDPNGGAFEDTTTDPKVIQTVNGVIATLPSGLTRADSAAGNSYVFTGWYTSSTDFTPANKVEDGAAFPISTTVYAGWNANEKVTFDPNGGTIAEATDYSFTDSTTHTLANANIKTLVDEIIDDAVDSNIKHHFIGWYDNNSGTYTDEHLIDTNYVFNGDTTVYAEWENNYKVTFNPNGGEFTDDTTAEKIQYTDSTAFDGTLGSMPNVKPTKVEGLTTYYSLNAWYTSDTDFIDTNKVTASTVLTGDVTLYAGWTDEIETINFYVDGTLYASKAVGKGTPTTTPTDPTKGDLTFIGWYTDTTFATPYDFTLPVNNNLELHALFKETVTVTVSGAYNDAYAPVVANNYVDFNSTTNKATIIKNENVGSSLIIYSTNGTLDTIAINNTAFDAADLVGGTGTKTIYIDENGTKQDSSSANDMMSMTYTEGNSYFTVNLLKVTADTTITLTHNDVNVNFYNGSSLLETKTVPFNVESDIEQPNDPTQTGYTFLGWFNEDTFETPFVFEDRTLVDDTNVYAQFAKDYTLTVYYGYGREHGITNTLADVFTGTGALLENDTGYSLKGTRANAYSSVTGSRYDKPWQTEIDYVELYYNGTSVRVDHTISPKGNSIINSSYAGDIYYTDAGEITRTSTGNHQLVILRNSVDAENGSVASRWYAIPGAIDYVMHYYDEHKITVNNITTSTVSEDYDKYFVDKSVADKTTTIVSGDYSDDNGFAITVTPKTVNVNNITISNGTKTADIKHDDINKTLYLSSEFTLSETQANGDILKYQDNVFTYYNVTTDLTINYNNQKTITLDPGKGTLVSGETTVLAVDGKIEEPELVSEQVLIAGTTWYFTGWYNSASQLVDFDEEILNDDTFTAQWSDVPVSNIQFKDVYNTDGNPNIEAVYASKVVNINPNVDSALVKVTETGIVINAYCVHGTLEGITVKQSDAAITDLIEPTGTIYIDENGDTYDTAPATYKVAVTKISDTEYQFEFNQIEENLIITFNYQDLNVKYLFTDGSEAAAPTTTEFNTSPVQPDDPVKEGYWFDGWFEDVACTIPFDFSKGILDDTTIYAGTTIKHTLSYIGAGAIDNTPINDGNNHEWESRVGAGMFDAENALAYTKGDWHNVTEGVSTLFNTSIGNLTKITFEYNGHTIEFTGDDINLKNSTGYYLYLDGTYAPASGAPDDNVLAKFVHAGPIETHKYFNLRYYNIVGDVTVTCEYKDVSVNFTDPNKGVLVFNIDTKTEHTVVGEDGRSFVVPSTDLKGDNAHSIRFAIDPKLSMICGLHIENVDDPTDYLDWTFDGSKASTENKQFGKIKIAYDIASSATDGNIYVRFLNLNKSLAITPIYLEDTGAHTATLVTAANLTVSNDDAPKGITVSSDKKTITVPYGNLWKVTTDSPAGSCSFRWNLAPTAGYDLEYSKLEIVDANTGAVLGTLGTGFEIYEGAGADQTDTLMLFANGIFVKYNKAKDSSAQIRVWSVTKDVKLKVYYKDFKHGGSDVAPENAVFDAFPVKVTFKLLNTDANKTSNKFSYITPSTRITTSTVTDGGKTYNTLTATSKNLDLTGDNATIKKDDDVVTAHILRLSFADISKYVIKKVKIYTTGANPVSYELPADQLPSPDGKSSPNNKTIKDTDLGQIQFVRNSADVHIRFNRIFTQDEIFVEVEYESLGNGPYTGVLVSDDRTHATLDSKLPKTVIKSKDERTIKVPEGSLKSSASSQSAYWYLSSLAGMEYEYSKIEVYQYNNKTKMYELTATLGDKFQSFKTYKNGLGDQTQGKQLQGLSIRYNKSKNGEAQIRVWNVFKPFKLVVYYKNYQTGEEYKANDPKLNLVYDGIVNFNGADTRVELDISKKAPITKLNGYRSIRFDAYATEDNGVKYLLYTEKLGENIDYITIEVDGKTYELGKDTIIGKATTLTVPGAKVRFYRSTDGYAQVRVWALTNDINIKTHVSYGHKNTVKFYVGDHGWARIADIPASAKILDSDLSTIVVQRGATYNSKAGNKSSIRYDVTPDFGYDIDYITFTVAGQTYKLDSKLLPNGTTLTTKIAPGLSVRYNVDSNGIAQIRLVHVDRDCSVRVYYKEVTHKVTINTRKLAVMRAEGYNNGSHTKFSPNYAVSYVPGGATTARQNGIKYWLQPVKEGSKINCILIENTYGDYVVAGGGFEPTEYEDYKVKGVTCRYYQGYDGKVELRLWGILDDIKITVFYDDEEPVRGVAVPEDIETYDIGIFKEGFDNQDLEGNTNTEPKPDEEEKKDVNYGLIAGGVGAVGIAGGAYYFLSKKKKKEEEEKK